MVENLRARGFVRVSTDGVTRTLDELEVAGVDLTKARDPLVVVDRLTVSADAGGRVADAVALAFVEGDQDCTIILSEPISLAAGTAAVSRLNFTERYECPNDGTQAPVPTPQLFSFNNPRGACPKCNGFGATLEYDEALIVPYPGRSLRDGAIDPWTKPRYDKQRRLLAEFARAEGIPFDAPWQSLSEAQRRALLHTKTRRYTGIFPFLQRLEDKRYKQYIRVFLRQHQSAQTCTSCLGAKLQPDALHVRVAGQSIADVADLPASRLLQWLDELTLSDFEQQVAEHVITEARNRVRFLCDVGLGYLSLNRSARSLSGGEAQRIALANSLGAHLSGYTVCAG